MKLVHYGHACVLVETHSARLLFDPGTLSAGFEGLRDLDGVLFTHQHADHIDGERLPALLQASPGARVVTDPGTAQTVSDLGISAETAHPGDSLEIAGAAVAAVGGDHAVIHPELPNIPNVGFIVDHGAFYHPGDAFHVPEQRVDVLGLPTGAPWLKASEAVEFLRAVAPRVAVPIHEAVLAGPALQLHYGLFTNLAPRGTEVRIPNQGTETAF